MKPTWLTQFKINQQRQFSGTHLFIFFLKYLAFRNFYMFQNKFADFKNPIVLHNVLFNMNASSEIVLRIATGFKYFRRYWSWKSNKNTIKDRRVNLYVNEPESSITLVAFPTNTYFQTYLNWRFNNKFFDKFMFS